MTRKIKNRSIILIFGIISMLFAGIIYAWSILKAPLAGLDIGPTSLALNFTLTMCAFCLGGLGGSRLARKIGVRASIILGGLIGGGGIALTGTLQGDSALPLYLCYALMGGGGIGIVYNVIISSVNSHFPDKKGFCSGCLMMGFGLSALLLGNLAGALFDIPSVGWRSTFLIIGIALAAVMLAAGMVIYRNDEPAQSSVTNEEGDQKDYTPLEMLSRPSFYMAFIALICLTAVGSAVISFARDLAIWVGAKAGLATTLVGVLSVCNGLGRILTGKTFDLLGRRKTMLMAAAVTMLAAGVTLLSVGLKSLPLCIVGLCLTGISYGTSPTVSSAFTSAFYGKKHFATNFSIMNFNLIGASFAATACTALLGSSGGYVRPFVVLLCLSAVSIVLNIFIKKA